MRTSSRIRLKYKRRNFKGNSKNTDKSFREKIQVFIKLVLIIKNILIHCINKKSDNKKSDSKKSDNKKSK